MVGYVVPYHLRGIKNSVLRDFYVFWVNRILRGVL